MKKICTLLLLLLLNQNLNAQCSHTLRLTDTYGDGWNGGTVSVSVNGVLVINNVTIASGYGPSDFTFNASTSDLIRVYETAAGSYPTEMRVQVFDGGMTSIIAQQDPATGTLVTGGTTGSANCPPPMVISAATVTQASSASVLNCGSNQQIVCLQITTTGASNAKTVTQIQTNFNGTAAITALSSAKIYYTGTTNTFSTTTLFGSTSSPSTSTYNINGSQVLSTGVNYFWLAYDLNNSGTVGATVDGIISQFTATAVNYNSGSSPAITTTNPAGSRTTTICTGPGGVASGLSHWVKSNTGVTGNPVTNWSDNSVLQILGDMVSLSAAARPSVQTAAINYENYIRFDGTDDGMKSTNAVTAVTSGLFSNSDNSIFMVKNNRQAGNTGFGAQVDFKWETAGSGAYRVGFEVATTSQRFDFVDDGAGQNAVSTTNMIGQNRIVSVLTQATSNSISVNALPNATKNHGTSLSLAGAGATTRSLFLGCNDNSTWPIFADVDIAEEIIFNNRLSAADELRVESYLAVKYAITLGNSASPSNYTSSNNTVTWTALSAYQNNIIGLGRDDNATLYTKQSKQPDDSVRIYLGTLQATNAANANTFSVNHSFVLQGANTGKLCATGAANAEMPVGLTNCALTSRLEREWKVVRTNMAQNYNMDIKLNACGAPGAVNTAHLRFLVDDDGNFANGGTQCYYNGDGTGIVISYSNPTITISNISTTHIPNNAFKFVTIASINIATPLPVEVVAFQAEKNSKKTVDLTWQTVSERNNDFFTIYKSSDAQNWDYFGSMDGAGNSNSILNYYLEDPAPYTGNNYYKLTQTDFNGETTEIGTRVVSFENGTNYSLYPNPASGLCTIGGVNNETFKASIYNQFGALVAIVENNNSIDTKSFAEGVYYVQIEDNFGLQNLKLVVKH